MPFRVVNTLDHQIVKTIRCKSCTGIRRNAKDSKTIQAAYRSVRGGRGFESHVAGPISFLGLMSRGSIRGF